ncbi:MAG: YchF family ATPase, partial [Leptospiraceae bacterium]|nr:YchF family ATPase [Leptospiraceae bacterium]
SLEKQLDKLGKKAKSGDKDATKRLNVGNKIREALENELPARAVELDKEEARIAAEFYLLTIRPVLYVMNTDEDSLSAGNEWTEAVEKHAAAQNSVCVRLCGKIEEELGGLSEEEQREYLESMGMEEPGLHRMIRASYALLGLITFFTAGEQEVRAWTVRSGSTAPEAAGEIHSDIEKGFIRAEVTAYDDLVQYGSMNGAKDAGKMRLEGKEYIVKDGDICYFRFNV